MDPSDVEYDTRDLSVSIRQSPGIGETIYSLAAEIFPICRSITGNGVRETLRRLKRYIDLSVYEVPTGTRVFDWTVPREWNIKDAYIKSENGERVVDFNRSNLHVLGYSVPVHTKLTLEELKQHIYTIPDQPDLIPYRTSYYNEQWGFCMSHRQLMSLPDGVYEVLIDSSLVEGHLTYAEYRHPGRSDEEVLLSAHICHPSLANDNCSGVALLTHLARMLSSADTHYSYRFIFAPGTIGAITWLARNEHVLTRVRHGLVVSCVGDSGEPTYKKSRRGDALVDRAMSHVLYHSGKDARILEFSPYGYDERQYCSPGFDLPVGLFQRSQFGTFPEYHTSGDNLQFIRPEYLAESFGLMAAMIEILENNQVFLGTCQKCEPQLGRRGLYESDSRRRLAMLWVLNLSDGKHALLDIAERAGLPFADILMAARRLIGNGLLEAVGDTPEGA